MLSESENMLGLKNYNNKNTTVSLPAHKTEFIFKYILYKIYNKTLYIATVHPLHVAMEED